MSSSADIHVEIELELEVWQLDLNGSVLTSHSDSEKSGTTPLQKVNESAAEVRLNYCRTWSAGEVQGVHWHH
jgi:hypothetical protein